MARTRKVLASLFATALLLVAVAVPVAAAQNQDGLVNVAIGDITIEDVNVAVAAIIAANICGVNVGPVVVLAQEVDAQSTQETVCTNRGGKEITLTQN